MITEPSPDHPYNAVSGIKALGSLAALVACTAGGAAGGAAGALTASLLNGSNIGQVTRNTLTGAFWGAISGFLMYGAGEGTFLESLFKHTFSQGWLEGIQGGNMFHGFMMGAVSGAGGNYIHNNLQAIGRFGEISANAILSGTVSELGGGKFANGAITGAFSIMFNDMMHEMRSNRRKYHDLIIYGKNKMKNRIDAMKRMIERSKFTGNEVCAAILEDGSVVIYHDSESTSESCIGYHNDGTRNGKNVETYHNMNNGKDYVIKTYLHTHPYSDCKDNYLCVSQEDFDNAYEFNNEINILFLDGSFYRQTALPGYTMDPLNYRGNVFDKSFAY